MSEVRENRIRIVKSEEEFVAGENYPVGERYLQEEKMIAQGAFGDVYRGWDMVNERLVAIKRLKGGYGVRNEREAGGLAKLQHPGISTVYEHQFDEKGDGWIVMEWVEGRTLKQLRDDGDLTGELMAEAVRKTASALDYLVSIGMAHGDIKDSCIIWANEPGRGPVIIDWGSASHMGHEIFWGTPVVAAPERLWEELSGYNPEPTGASDRYELAELWYQAIVERYPFYDSGDFSGALRKITGDFWRVVEGDVVLGEAVDVFRAQELNSFFEKAFVADPDKRFDSAGEMAEAFLKALGYNLPK